MLKNTVVLQLVLTIPCSFLISQAQVHILLPSVPTIGSTVCRVRPYDCEISCPFGYKVGAHGNCRCACVDDPCELVDCGPEEVCRRNYNGTAQCVSQTVIQGLREIYWKPGKCPEVLKSECRTSCSGDSDCEDEQKCCITGCGRECMFPIKAALKPTFVPHISITVQPVLLENATSDKIGFCPPKNSIPNKNCNDDCQHDDDCSGVEKCCDNGCGKVCSPPDKTTHCIHLLSAVNRLPKKSLATGYVPNCTVDGSFERIQCNKIYCWCVDVTQGWEIPGTAVFKEDGRPNCQVPRECPNVVCLNPCPHGLKTQSDGCPMANCECKNICDDVQCSNPMEACQLVEPDCAEPPCLPLPRCLLNPCPHGLPMTLPNGVTALCTRSTQCSSSFWCHQIGYNGLGFCCSIPESAIREGQCPARIPKQSDNCDSECRSDAECKIGSKCCFDGCGLKCLSVSFPPNPFETKPAKWIEIQEQNKTECPENNPQADHSKCGVQCQRDSDCSGMKRCCAVGCSSLCTYPTKTTACIHDVITHEVYAVGRLPKCDPAGNYEQQQCDSLGCFCVNVNTGKLIPFSRQHSDAEMTCSEKSKDLCRQFKCDKNCSYGFEVDEDGCELCECKNPCRNLECSNNELCIMLPVQCYQKNHCPPQPRCVPNICPTGIPFSSFADVTDLCADDSECPNGYWCNLVGFNKKGLCCMEPRQQISPGLCPVAFVTMDTSTLRDICEIRCKSDSDCQLGAKCCFNGCGTSCITSNADELKPTLSVKPKVNATNSHLADKNWQCPKATALNNCTEDAHDLCTSDFHCPGTQKCCSFGCGRICTYPQKASACIHLKAALQRIGAQNSINCKADGSFDMIQCNQNYCWCSSPEGTEIEGTRVSSAFKPTCDSYRLCTEPKCMINITCPYGRELDVNGCHTCKCFNPCKDIVCPDANEFCVPNAVECTTALCLPVPQCVVKACSKSLPVIDEVTFEPLLCKENSQCKHMGRPAYCRVFKSDGGYCCWGNEEAVHSGRCPAENTNINVDCIGNCVSDEDCLSNEKCCYNGCGLSCLPAEQYAPIRSKANKIGECLIIPETEPLNCINSGEDLCKTDEDCPGIQKCCLYGCNRQCSYADVTTACLHAKAAAESFKEPIYIPQCDSDGEFYPLQASGQLRFCVDKKGKEVQGTRSSLRNPNCRLPRSCPISSCTLHCPLGYRKDSSGCNQCACYDPCKGVKCLKTQICRIVERECYTKNCSPFPKCIVNACPKGEPLVSLDTQQLAICTLDGIRRCPKGYFCHRIGLFSKNTGYCCSGNDPDSPEECPIVPELVVYESAKCVMHCRSHMDCKRGICCFNGCGTYCKPISVAVPEINEENVSSTLNRIASTELKERLGVCPVNPISNPGCRSECTMDSECPQFHKCCPYGCGRLCQYPRIATVCIHRVAFNKNTEMTKPENLTFPQCSADGMFKMIQCDSESRFCWCVDIQTGVEIIGTRTLNIGNSQPNCYAPRSCTVKCDNVCVYGVRLDGMGCPMNGICECRNPCEDLKCSRFDDVCILKPVTCLTSVCPPVPVCKSNPCFGGELAIKDSYGNSIPCIRDEECGKGQCQYVLGEQQLGVCCPRKRHLTSQLSTIKRGECPTQFSDGVFTSQNCTQQCSSDGDCDDVEKCCEYGCSKLCMAPTRTTNCIQLRAAVARLQRDKKVAVMLNMPSCDAVSGMFNPVQCDASDTCWCVDTITGNEFYGTKTKLFSTGFNVCSSKRSCTISCEDRGVVCPFGLETDSTGCAPDADCRCRNPCAQVQCQTGYVCVLRPRECSDQICVPIPTCEKNWCANGRKPAVEPRTYTQFTCLENRTQICPSGFYCTGYDYLRRGICCPGQEQQSFPGSAESCPHGDAFSNSPDGSPLKCSVNTNGCPSSHYCLSKPNESTGICCVTKRYVCNLKLDSGPCTVSVPRFYYDAENQTCLPFYYGGCSGNLNNFGSKSECERFCVGTGVDPLLDFMNDDGDVGNEIMELGFSLVGPVHQEKDQADFEMAVIDYLKKAFELEDGEIKNLSIHKSNSVRFSIYGPDAHAKASNISNAVANGKFKFKYGGNSYRAEPHSWFSHQIAERASSSHFGVFWTLIAASVVFGVAIFVALLFACFFMYRHGKHNTDSASSFRGTSPSTNYATNIGYAASSSEGPFSGSNEQQKLPHRQLQVFTTDDIDQVKQSQQSDEWDESSSDEHTQGGRRPTRTTLYY